MNKYIVYSDFDYGYQVWLVTAETEIQAREKVASETLFQGIISEVWNLADHSETRLLAAEDFI